MTCQVCEFELPSDWPRTNPVLCVPCQRAAEGTSKVHTGVMTP